MASSFRSATVEECVEGPSDTDACGEALPYPEDDGTIVPLMTPAYEHPSCESAEAPQPYPTQAQPVQLVGQYPPEVHHPQSFSHPPGNANPPPKAPTPPFNPPANNLSASNPPASTPPTNKPPAKKSKRKTSSSSRQRNKDRPEYYGIRGPSTAVVPAVPPEALARNSNIRIARRPTTGWYLSGAAPLEAAADPAPGLPANSPPRIHAPPANMNKPPRDMPPANTFRHSGAVQIRGQQPPPPSQDDDSRGWETAEAPNRGLETPHPGGGSPGYPTPQPSRPGPGIIVLNQGHGGPPQDPNSQARGMENEYYQPPPPPPPPQAPPAQHNPHGVVVLSSNGSKPAGPPHEPPPQRSFHQISPVDDQRRSPSPLMSQYDDRAPVHQMPGRQSVHPMHSPPAQPHNGYRRQRDQPSQEPPSPTPGPYQEFQRLSLENTPPNDRRVRQIPAHREPDQFRSHDAPTSPSHSDSASSPYGPSVNTFSHGPHRRVRGGYPAANEAARYTPHPQRRNSFDRQPPAQRRPPPETPAPAAAGAYPESPPRQQSAPKTPHHGHCPQSFYTIPEESNHAPPAQRRIDYAVEPSRDAPPQGSYRRRDSYSAPEEDFELDAHEPNMAWSHKHAQDIPTLPEGHPFLRMKDMALATILKEFRTWQSAGMPGRRGPHPRRPPFACPFAKGHPLHYKDCFSDALPTIAEVKEHVSRCHSIPIYCPRCMDLFDDEKARDHHIRYAECHPQQWSTPDGITESQKRQLRSGVPTYLPPADQWSHIYSIVFQPRGPPPESPYVDDTLHEDVSTFRDFLETRGPRALSDVLTFRGAATWHLPNEERDLTAFRCLVLQEGVRDLVEQWARRSDSIRSPSSLASSSGGPDQQRTPSMGSFASSAGGYAPASPLEGHHWDPRPRIREEHWDDYAGHPPEQAEFADPRRQKVAMYVAPRREAAPYS